jgi:hypothetical protein
MHCTQSLIGSAAVLETDKWFGSYVFNWKWWIGWLDAIYLPDMDVFMSLRIKCNRLKFISET